MSHRRHMSTTALAVAGLIVTALPASAEIVGETVSYTVGGESYEGYYARNTQLDGPLPTVMLVHDWDGIDGYERRRAEMLAELGYAAFAVDLYGAGLRPDTVEGAQEASGALYSDREAMRARLMAGRDELATLEAADPDRLVVAGYCFGGQAVLEMARAGAPAEGFVPVHASLGTPEGQDYSDVTAPILFLHGTADQVAGMNDVASLADRLDAAGVTQRWELYGGAPHAFTVFSSDSYHERADQASWTAFTDFLTARLR